MNLRLLPTTPIPPSTPSLTSKNPNPIFTTNLPKYPSLRTHTCSLRARAAIGEGGFTAEKTEKTFYQLLGLEAEESSFEEIKKAYKQLARKYHPDVSPPDRMEEFTRRFIEVHEAYETLSDPCRRAIYDMDLASGLHLNFSSRRFNQDMDERSQWKNRWENQLDQLKRKSIYKEYSTENLSWGDRMRRQRAESSST